MNKKIVKIIIVSLLEFLIIVLVFFCGFFEINPIDIIKYFVAQVGSEIGVSVGVPSNPFNQLAEQLEEKEISLLEKEKELEQKEAELGEKNISQKENRFLFLILGGGILLVLILIILNFYLDYRRKGKPRFYLLLFVIYFLFLAVPVSATSLIHVSDTISNSAPNESATHIITFTFGSNLTESYYIQITFPAEFTNISQGNVTCPANSTALVSSQVVKCTVDEEQTITAGSQTVTITGVTNPSSVSSYKINIKTYDASLNLLDRADAMIAIVQPVQIGTEKGEEEEEEEPAFAEATAGEEEEEEEEEVSAGGGGGGGGGEPPPSVEVAPSTFTGTVTISPELGGSTILTNVDKSSAKIYFPKKAVSIPVIVKIASIPKRAIVPFYSVPPGLKIVSNWIYSFTVKTADGDTVSTFLKQVTFTFKYTDKQVFGLDEATLKIYRGVPSTNKWIVVPTSQVNPVTNTITATVTDVSLFVIMGSPSLIIPKELPADLDGDGKVDLVDFSILFYNWGKPKNPKADLNNDALVDLVDFSIMFYWWTG